MDLQIFPALTDCDQEYKSLQQGQAHKINHPQKMLKCLDARCNPADYSHIIQRTAVRLSLDGIFYLHRLELLPVGLPFFLPRQLLLNI